MVTTRPRAATRSAGVSVEFQLMLDSLDERIQAFEISEAYYQSLTSAEWEALRGMVTRNGIPLRLAHWALPPGEER